MRKILLFTLVLLTTSITGAFACDCIFSSEYTRDIEDLTETATEENRFVVLVEIVGEETRTVDGARFPREVTGYLAQVIEVLGGCVNYDVLFIPNNLSDCGDYDVSGIEIGDTGLAMGFADNDNDQLNASQCDTRESYYNIEDDKMDSATGLTRTSISMDALRKYDACSLTYTVYPNPASTSIQIARGGELIQESFAISIIDESGRVALKGQGSSITINHLAAGTYFISIGRTKVPTPLVIAH